MRCLIKESLLSAALLCALVSTGHAQAPAPAQKPNILFIMGDDIGIMQPSIYHRGLMVGETPNIDRIGQEGALFTHYYAEQSCTAGRNAFFTGMHPLRTGMIPPQLPGSPSYLRPGTPSIAKFLLDLGYTRPRVKLLPSLKIGAEALRSRGYTDNERVTEEMMKDFDASVLICANSRTE